MDVFALIPVLQVAIGPVVLISGAGLLILALTNRLGRVVDRGRNLATNLRTSSEYKHPNLTRQLQNIRHRACLLQRSIIFAVLCLLLAVALIVTLFLAAAMQAEIALLIGGLFVASLASLVISLAFFLRELNQSLVAFRLDIE